MQPHSPSDDAARERALIQVQAASGAAFAVFLLLHLVNQMFAVAGPDAYDGVQAGLRGFYQALPVEILLVCAALVVHIGASVWRMSRRRRRRQAAPRALRSRLQRYTAIFLLVAVPGHVLATRGVSLAFDAPLGFDGLAFTMVRASGYFFPYYLVLAVAGLYHLLNGLSLALPRLGLRLPPAARSGRLLGAAWLAGALALALGVAGLAGAFSDVEARALASRTAEVYGDLGILGPPR